MRPPVRSGTRRVCRFEGSLNDRARGHLRERVVFIDPSGHGKDEASYTVLKLLHGGMFLIASGGFLGGYDDKTLNALVATAKKQDVKLILCESN